MSNIVMDEISDKNLRKYYEKLDIVPLYQIDQLINLRKGNKLYKPVNSNIQIRTIMKHSNNFNFSYVKSKLLSLLEKHVAIKDAYNTVYRLINLPLTDSCMYKIIGEIIKKEERMSGPSYTNDINRRCKKVELFSYALLPIIKKKNFIVRKYLDLGCGDCSITPKYGKVFKLTPENIHGADIESWGNYNKDTRKVKEMTFTQITPDQPYNYPDNNFSIISCFMVLHHVANLDFCLREINRITEINGYLYITEHMVTNFMEKMVVDIEHSIYEIAIRNNNQYHKTYVNNFYHWLEWKIIMEKYGFKQINYEYLHYDIMNQDDPSKKAWILYEKVTNI
jgi:ubiquinone/menaquinone biosynthesis C-methylase UbiE